MQENEIIILNEFCVQHNIELRFLHALRDSGLVEVTVTDEQICIPEKQLPDLEKMVRLHYEMGINLEGIETINHLLNRMIELQEMVNQLNNRLHFYEQHRAD